MNSDNPDVDIYGSNLYNRYLKKRKEKLRKKSKVVHQVQKQVSTTPITYMQDGSISENTEIDDEDEMEIMLEDGIVSEYDNGDIIGLQECNSVLVCTGVYSSTRDYSEKSVLLNHNHRDFIMDPELKKPTMIAANVYEAIQLIFKEEGIS